MSRWRLRAAGRTERGPVRALNEDDYQFYAPHDLLVVCDGMGGSCNGRPAAKVASWATVERFQRGDPAGWDPGDEEPDAARLREAVAAADHRVRRVARFLTGAGAAIVALHVAGDRVSIAHVGDCRAYRWRCGALTQITADHRLFAYLRANGIEPTAAQLAYAGVLVRALGFGDALEVELHAADIAPGDLYALCTDGLHELVSDDELAAALGRVDADARQDAPRRVVDELVERALERGARDNVTLCVAGLTRDPAPQVSHGGMAPPRVPWLYNPSGPLPDVPRALSELEPHEVYARFGELYRLIMGDD